MITKEIANQIFDILINYVGIDNYWRENFVNAIMSPENKEYRIQGLLGFGGKFRNVDNKWYVDCYPEHMNESRQLIIERTNQQLCLLKSKSPLIV